MAGLEGQNLDRYELRQLTGRGGMADVYRGFDPVFQRIVAVKVFKREDEELLRRFVREARLMASLNHPHLMPVFDTGAAKVSGLTYYYIVMPFMDGGSLRARIRRCPVALIDACRYLREIADALDNIHSQGIIHRDIKSSNVLLDDDDNCYLSDFGIARTASDETQLTSTGNVLGTVDYVAPELFESNHRADARSDLYSLGILVFEMVTGQLPFSAENQIAVVAMHVNKRPPLPSSFSQNISSQVERVVLKGLEKNPDLRYGSATEFAEAFCRAIYARAGTQGRVPTPVWDEATTVAPKQDEPLILPPAPATFPAIPPMGRQPVPAPSAYSTGGEYPYAPGDRQTPAYGPQTQSFSPERSRARIVTVIALVTLLIVIGPIVYVLVAHPFANTGTPPVTPGQTQTATTASTPSPTATQSPTATPNHTATAQAIAAATQQAKNVTATAVAGVTVTAQAHITATAGVIQTATAGKVLYQDALTNADNPATQAEQWDQKGNCTFQSDGYHVTKGTSLLGSGELQGCREAGVQYQNMTVSVDMTMLSGHSGGVFFRVGPKAFGAYSGYLFELDNAGNYKISKSSNFSTGSGNTILQDWTASSAFKPGNTAKNTLQLIASGNNLSFYLNGTFLMTLQDASYTSGDIAFLATTTSNGANADIAYSNLNIYEHS